MFKKKMAFLLGVMLLFSVAGYAVCTATGSKQLRKQDGEVRIVTSFYPMYVLARNLTEGVTGVTVTNLTENQTGCLHDYQLTAKDMKELSAADIFVINGAGMELFMEKVLAERKTLPVIEASKEIELLAGSAHYHSHEGEGSVSEEHEYEEEENGHVWMDVDRYRSQALQVYGKLKELLPEKEEELTAAWQEYEEKLLQLSEEADALRQKTEGTYVVVFHEAFVYLADSLGMDVLSVLALDEETVPSAGEIAEVIEEIKYHGTAWILIEKDYASHAEKIVAETGASVLYLDPLVSGDGAADSYLNGMQENLWRIGQKVSER